MLQPDRQRSRVARAAVGGLHQTGATAGDDGVAGVAEARADLPCERVVGMLGRRARRAEHGHRALHLGECVEAARELRGDVVDAIRVDSADCRRLPPEPKE